MILRGFRLKSIQTKNYDYLAIIRHFLFITMAINFQILFKPKKNPTSIWKSRTFDFCLITCKAFITSNNLMSYRVHSVVVPSYAAFAVANIQMVNAALKYFIVKSLHRINGNQKSKRFKIGKEIAWKNPNSIWRLHNAIENLKFPSWTPIICANYPDAECELYIIILSSYVTKTVSQIVALISWHEL